MNPVVLDCNWRYHYKVVFKKKKIRDSYKGVCMYVPLAERT